MSERKKKWHHWSIVGKNGKMTCYLDGKKFNGTFESWIFSDWFKMKRRKRT